MVRNNSHGMEPTFYDESYPTNIPVEKMKRSMTLDLDFGRDGKRARMSGLPVLSSPDMNMLKLGSPDLEKLIMTNGLVSATPTPGSAVLFPTATPTEAQEMYARPFVEILQHLNQRGEPVEAPGQRVYADLDRQAERLPMAVVKDEPQTVPSASSSPPMSPIDMDTQEKIKLERKRQRNRVAASKCRRRKLERISKLEDKVKALKGENADLAVMVVRLKEHVCRLKEQVVEHVRGGCAIDTPY